MKKPMEDCKFCAGTALRSEYVGKGIRTMAINLNQMFGAINGKDKQDGIWLDEWNEFCGWIERLPYSELITLEEDTHEQA